MAYRLPGILLCTFTLLNCAHKAQTPEEQPQVASEKLAATSPVFLEASGSNAPCQGDGDCRTGELCHPETERCIENYPNPRMLDLSFKSGDDCKLVNLYFPFNSTEIVDEAQRWLQYDVRCMKLRGAKEVVIEGHADARGPAGYNQKLSVERAESVARLFNSAGYDVPVKATGRGEREPMKNGKTEKDYAFNRRVEFTVH